MQNVFRIGKSDVEMNSDTGTAAGKKFNAKAQRHRRTQRAQADGRRFGRDKSARSVALNSINQN